MANPYICREGGATVTVFVPYDCGNNCPFCINKQEYADTSGFSAEAICESIAALHAITPACDFVFTGGEPLADLDTLQLMLDRIPEGHRVFINTTLPVMPNVSEDELVRFLNANKQKLTCVNVSRHLYHFVVESSDSLLARLEVPVRINCVLFGRYTVEMLRAFVDRFQSIGLPIQFRSDYTKTTPENLYDEDGDQVFQALCAMLPCTGASGCRIRCNYDFGSGISYHKTLPYSTVQVERNGEVYDMLYDVIVKQTGEIHSDWTGVKMDMDRYRRVLFEPYDLHPFTPGNANGGVA